VKRLKLLLLIALLCMLGAAAGTIRTASSHSWYSQACCAGQHCERIPADAVTGPNPADGSYEVNYISSRGFHVVAHVRANQVKDSQDGGYHACAQSPERFFCLYVPVNS